MELPIQDIPYYYSYYTNGKEISLLSPKLHGDKYQYNPGDRYPNEKNVAPAGWEQKLQSVSYHTELPQEYPVNDAFGPIYSKQACDKLQTLKHEYCKASHKKGCSKDMDDESIKLIHDEALRCRNIRALESTSFCSTKKNISVWIDPNEYGHIVQVNQLANKALKCLDIYNKNIRSRRSVYKRTSSRKKRRRSTSNRKIRSKRNLRSKSR